MYLNNLIDNNATRKNNYETGIDLIDQFAKLGNKYAQDVQNL